MTWLLALSLALAAPSAAPAQVTPVAESLIRGGALPMHIGGRTRQTGSAALPHHERQWPGSYFETAFTGTGIFLRIGPGDVILHVQVDDLPAATLVKPAAGAYRIDGLAQGRHRVRVQVATESQAGPTSFHGFYPMPATRALKVVPSARQIEFIGDSHTVGYGNISPTSQCTPDQVWASTDTQKGIPGLLARRYGADFQVNAISGRGVVRNYDGHPADTLPQAYPFVLFDKAVPYREKGWKPQLIVIALGTNDFSTPLKPAEKWKSREALRADFQARYVGFVQDLRRRNPRALFVLWATDRFNGEIDAQVRQVVARLRAAGEAGVEYVPVRDLAMSGCHGHPSTADDASIADALGSVIEARPAMWRRKSR